MNPMLPLSFVLLAVFAPDSTVSDSSAPRDEDKLPKSNVKITSKELSHHVHFLAGDELRGRKAGTEDAHRAARYLVRALERAGFEPGGDDGTFLQRVPLRQTVWTAPHQLTVHTDVEWDAEHGVDFSVRINGLAKDTGRLTVAHVKEAGDVPEGANAEVALLFHSRSSEMKSWLEAAGHEDGEGFGLVMRVGGTTPGRSRGTMRSGGLQLPKGEIVDGVEEVTLRGKPGTEAEAIQWVDLKFHGGPEDVLDYNVVAKLPGVGTEEHPELKDEVVVLSAHYDHLGVRSRNASGPEDGEDTIYNGADDDASGVATVLEMAEALGQAKERPARTVYVLLAAAEEHGMLGTHYFADNCPVDLTKINCNLNFEMVGRPDETVGGPGQLWLSGFERSSLGPRLKELGIGVAEDMRPEQNFFARSDNIVFVQKGIVGQTFSSYNMHDDYHQASDDPESLDYEHMEQAVRACFDAVRLVVDGEITPTWNEGEPNLGRR
tara:strand:- start:5841 stop:7310 length:1470 start_codon:yes stop_codon:yes gene_type:complete